MQEIFKTTPIEDIENFDTETGSFLSNIDKSIFSRGYNPDLPIFGYSSSQPTSPVQQTNLDKKWTIERVAALINYFKSIPNMDIDHFMKNENYPQCLTPFNENECKKKLVELERFDLKMINSANFAIMTKKKMTKNDYLIDVNQEELKKIKCEGKEEKLKKMLKSKECILNNLQTIITESNDIGKYIYINDLLNSINDVQVQKIMKVIIKIAPSIYPPFLITTKSSSDYINDLKSYIENMTNLTNFLYTFLTKEEDYEENFENFIKARDDLNIMDCSQKIILLLNIINEISLYHYRNVNFIDKVEKLIRMIKLNGKINKKDILYIFRNNKRLLLFLFKERIISPDHDTYKLFESLENERTNYLDYFYDIIHNFKGKIEEKKLCESHEEKQKNGENDREICRLIRIDSITSFIEYCNKNKISLNSYIEPSIYETNLILIEKKNVSLIEYAAFFGSVQIFKYLLMKYGIELNGSLWIFAIHGHNMDIINLLEENNIIADDWMECLEVAIKCHHNDLAEYFISEKFKDFDLKTFNDTVTKENNEYRTYYSKNYLKSIFSIDCAKLIFGISYYNFHYIQYDKLSPVRIFHFLCKYNYFDIIQKMVKSKNIEINEKVLSRYLKNTYSLEICKLLLNEL